VNGGPIVDKCINPPGVEVVGLNKVDVSVQIRQDSQEREEEGRINTKGQKKAYSLWYHFLQESPTSYILISSFWSKKILTKFFSKSG
jgi:hypothetical protein